MLTDIQCRAAKPTGKDYKLSDSKGLYLFVTKAGFRSWRWKYRFAGKEKRLVLGSYPDMSLAKAREARDTAASALRSGADPAAEQRRQARETHEAALATFEKVAREWHEIQKSRWVEVHAADVLTASSGMCFPQWAGSR